MVNMKAISDCLMTIIAVVPGATLAIYVKRLCHVPNMKEVGAYLSRNLFKRPRTRILCVISPLSNH